MSDLISFPEFAKALQDVGVIEDARMYRRIVIDAQDGCLVVMYLEKFTDKKLLSVVTDLGGIRIDGEAKHADPERKTDQPDGRHTGLNQAEGQVQG
jgi:hypothetical protein